MTYLRPGEYGSVLHVDGRPITIAEWVEFTSQSPDYNEGAWVILVLAFPKQHDGTESMYFFNLWADKTYVVYYLRTEDDS